MARPPSRTTYVALGIVFAVIITTHLLGWLLPVERALRSLIAPTLGTAHSLSIQVGDSYRFFKDKNEFIASYQGLVSSTQKQLIDHAQLQLVQDENAELRKQINFIKKNKYTLVPAEVIGHDIESIDQTILLNKGSSDGVAIDLPVIVGEGILIGKVIKVDADTSVIRLVNDNQSRVGATILNRTKSLGVVEGGFGISLQMNLIPRDEIVQVGDSVITSGLEKNLPRGLVLGTVASIQNEAYKPFQEAILTPGADVGKLTLVSVLKL